MELASIGTCSRCVACAERDDVGWCGHSDEVVAGGECAGTLVPLLAAHSTTSRRPGVVLAVDGIAGPRSVELDLVPCRLCALKVVPSRSPRCGAPADRTSTPSCSCCVLAPSPVGCRLIARPTPDRCSLRHRPPRRATLHITGLAPKRTTVGRRPRDQAAPTGLGASVRHEQDRVDLRSAGAPQRALQLGTPGCAKLTRYEVDFYGPVPRCHQRRGRHRPARGRVGGERGRGCRRTRRQRRPRRCAHTSRHRRVACRRTQRLRVPIDASSGERPVAAWRADGRSKV